MKKTAIIILNYNNVFDTLNCINSISKYESKKNIKIVLIDNKSNELTNNLMSQYIKKNFDNYTIFFEDEIKNQNTLPYFSYLKLSKNYGYACGNNFGLILCNNDSSIDNIMILNNDIILTQEITPKLAQSLNTKDDIGIVCPLLLKDDGSIDHNCARLAITSKLLILQHSFLLAKINIVKKKILGKRYILKNTNIRKGLIEIQLPSGSCMLMKKNFINQIGCFDTNTFLYMEEDILYEKIKSVNKRNYLNLNLKAIHIGASTMKKTSSYFIMKATKDSILYFMNKYLKSPKFDLLLMRVILTIRLKKIQFFEYLNS